ncbi:hypothetical protein [Paraburkholderia phenoliruptrix]|uniref:hypothetical protein n=1 Tax=Paraburkholderia phenoliruptrix TaxID=252970 RepID=UPI001C4FA78C|nr:hypothetical protein [Paraburkholderia phenoliruptrix]MBW9100971.1 hypothetical protein [Paraburkholderia phenoliruptrix]
MKERPILFSGPMVRALLDGRKTQTRRIVTPQPVIQRGWVGGAYWERRPERGMQPADRWCIRDMVQFSPYGQAGDRLWVRETFAHIYRGNAMPETRCDEDVVYAADGFRPDEYVYGSWKPSIHMPRWASRITLEVTGVRVERLNDISEDDARAEGCAPAWLDVNGQDVNAYGKPTYRQGFARLWRDINGADSWDANPWVWVVEFKRVP